ncbi:MAG: hypothetical protein HC860_13625 [Alkalinema sp. RU_4_3]|nr:hypothetical protein [Alkalinema sp. RU_4_3]
MIPTNHRRYLLYASGRLVKYFMTGLLGFAVTLILCGSFGQLSTVALLLENFIPHLTKLFIAIVCFGFMSVVFESFS